MYTQEPILELWYHNDVIFYYGVLYLLLYISICLFFVFLIRLIALRFAWEAFWLSEKPEAPAT